MRGCGWSGGARPYFVRLRPLAELEVTDGGELEAKVVHWLLGLVDDQKVQENVVRVDGDVPEMRCDMMKQDEIT